MNTGWGWCGPLRQITTGAWGELAVPALPSAAPGCPDIGGGLKCFMVSEQIGMMTTNVVITFGVSCRYGRMPEVVPPAERRTAIPNAGDTLAGLHSRNS